MTIVLGRQFGNRIVLCSDTAITDLQGVAHEQIPGRLKAIVISEYGSVAYAGDADLAIDAIRTAALMASSGSELSEVIAWLTIATAKSSRFELLVATHDPEPELRKITPLGCSTPQTGAAIGDLSILKMLPGYAEADEDEPHEYGSAAERRLTGEFSNLFFQGEKALPSGIGGVPVILLGSPYGHTYQGQSVAFAWDTIDLAHGSTPAQVLDRASGMTEWRCSISSPTKRGVGIVSLYLPQIRTGYVLRPLVTNEPEIHREVDQSRFETWVQGLTD